MAKRSGLAQWAGIAVEGYTLTQTSHGVVHVLPVRGHTENGTYDQYVDRMKRTRTKRSRARAWDFGVFRDQSARSLGFGSRLAGPC